MAQVRRLYRCSDCGFQFHEWEDKSDPLRVECPQCPADGVKPDEARAQAEDDERIAAMIESGVPPARTTVKSVALKQAESMMADYGLTNMNDSGRQGECAAKAPPAMQSAEVQEMTRAMVEAKQVTEAEANVYADAARSFFQTPGKATPAKLQAHIAVAPAAAAEARKAGVDPVGLFHEAGKKGHLKMKHDVVAQVRG